MQNLKIMQSFCSEFGLTPASRARLYANSGDSAASDDPMESVLKEAGRMFSEAKARRVTQFIECLKHTKGEFHGEPFKLLPWQEKIIRDVFGTVRDAIRISICGSTTQPTLRSRRRMARVSLALPSP